MPSSTRAWPAAIGAEADAKASRAPTMRNVLGNDMAPRLVSTRFLFSMSIARKTSRGVAVDVVGGRIGATMSRA
jgi:hypothetical protein